jgi:hypothetical protein
MKKQIMTPGEMEHVKIKKEILESIECGEIVFGIEEV